MNTSPNSQTSQLQSDLTALEKSLKDTYIQSLRVIERYNDEDFCWYQEGQKTFCPKTLSDITTGTHERTFKIIAFDKDTESIENCDNYIFLLQRMFALAIEDIANNKETPIHIISRNEDSRGILCSSPELIRSVSQINKEIVFLLLNKIDDYHQTELLRQLERKIATNTEKNRGKEVKIFNYDNNNILSKKYRAIRIGNSIKITGEDDRGKPLTAFIFNFDKVKDQKNLSTKIPLTYLVRDIELIKITDNIKDLEKLITDDDIKTYKMNDTSLLRSIDKKLEKLDKGLEKLDKGLETLDKGLESIENCLKTSSGKSLSDILDGLSATLVRVDKALVKVEGKL